MEESLIDEQDEEKSVKQTSPSLSSNDDLKELCILLDEERHKMHEVAEQWRHFGTNAIHKLECQIVDYQEKLNDLEQRQVLILKENESLKFLIHEMINENPTKDKQSKQNVSIQTNFENQETSHHSCLHRPKPIYDPRASIQQKSKLIHPQLSDGPLQKHISIQNTFDAIKTAEVYESIEDMTGDYDESEKRLLKQFCNLVWKYLEDRSTPKSSCLL